MRALVALGMTVALASPALAQIPDLGVPVLGPNQSSQAPVNDNLTVGESAVSIIDSALPRNMLRLRLDLGYDDPQPTRAEYFMGKGGLPLLETKINSYQEASAYAEFAPIEFFSLFLEAPFRWINPDVNNNSYGIGDMNFGFKLCTWNSDQFLATLQLRVYDPTAEHGSLGTNHWTVEPALLGVWQPFTNIMLEGELRYWAPVGGTDFAGDIVRYGLGLSVGQVSPGLWFKPVLEGVAWTVLNGKSLVVTSPDSYLVQSAAGQTIINGYFGMRMGLGGGFDCYAGYGRCFTGNSWTRDFVRVELRLFY